MMALSYLQVVFGRNLLDWHRENPRPLPWKETNDPYKIWLSEIILQQTQVSQGVPYYTRFIDKYPSVSDLAQASEQDVLKLWQGLGYNSRARNLHKAAITIAEELGGYFPDNSIELQKLSGVGPYTAAAIASFAYGEEIPVVDTNVVRIVCRLLAIDDNPAIKTVQNRIRDFLSGAMKGHDPAEFNQAIMNFGALQCTPKSPDCPQCPLFELCEAHKLDIVKDLPVKPAKKPRRQRFFHYLVLHDDSKLVLRKRMENDIWQGMYDFPLIESESSKHITEEEIHKYPRLGSLVKSRSISAAISSIHTENQILSHQKIHCLFYPIFVEDLETAIKGDEQHLVVAHGDEMKYPVPKVIDCYFRVKSIFL